MVEHAGTHLDVPAHFIEGGRAVKILDVLGKLCLISSCLGRRAKTSDLEGLGKKI